MGLLRNGLMGAAPEGPRDNGGGFDAALRQAHGDPADFLHRPADQWRLLRIIVRLLFGGAAVLAWRRMAPSMAKASMTSETCRCQPCQERVSLWSRPNSFLAVSKPSSMAQRRPSTATRVSIPVPMGHQVVKKARSSSAILRRIRRPLVHRPDRLSLYSAASRSASSRWAQSNRRSPLLPAPADNRRQAEASSVPAISAAVPATGGSAPQELNWLLLLTPST